MHWITTEKALLLAEIYRTSGRGGSKVVPQMTIVPYCNSSNLEEGVCKLFKGQNTHLTLWSQNSRITCSVAPFSSSRPKYIGITWSESKFCKLTISPHQQKNSLTFLLRDIWILPWLVISLKGVVIGSWSPLSVASASIRRVCQVSSLNVNTYRGKKRGINTKDSELLKPRVRKQMSQYRDTACSQGKPQNPNYSLVSKGQLANNQHKNPEGYKDLGRLQNHISRRCLEAFKN